MGIYRGPGGVGDAVNDAASEASATVIARDEAVAAKNAALVAQAAAELAETNAETAQAGAEAAQAAAEAVATDLSDDIAAALAAQIAAEAARDEAEAAQAAAETAETNAETAAATATTQASNASTSASTASTAATNASNSASAASTSATNAASSASSASTSATNASNSATSASGSATSATASASSASTSETNAAASATSASGSATTATTQAGLASTSASNAASSASAASTSETNAAASASSASSSASSAASAQTAAETARDQTLTAYDNFDDRYLGAKTSDPTVDNDGNALIAGSLYFNSSAQAMRVYTGSVWVDAYSSGTTFLAKANNLSDLPSTSTARTNLGLGTAATTDATAYATAAQGTNADTAYGWGDHATEGYAIYPTQTGNSGKFLSTNGSSASWETVNVTPALDDLSDVAITTPSTDQVLKYNGSGWVNGAAPAGGQYFGTAATKAVAYNASTIAENLTLTENSMSVGPITINSGYTVTVNAGKRWVIL